MKINDAGLALIKSFEGCKLESYQDIIGIWTIGYGHTGPDVVPNMVISQDRANELLAEDLGVFENGVTALVKLDTVSSNQFSALVCFSYNVGLNNLKSSTLLKKLNEGDVSGASLEFLKWDKAGGKEVPGLLRRRKAEKALFVA